MVPRAVVGNCLKHTSSNFISRGLGLSHIIDLNAKEGGNKMNPRLMFAKDNKFHRFRKKFLVLLPDWR